MLRCALLILEHGPSPVNADELRRRLYTHLRFATEARDHRRQTLYWPRYEYAASFGARYTLILCRKDETPKFLEEQVLCGFAETYRSWPVANGTGAWPELRTLEESLPAAEQSVGSSSLLPNKGLQGTPSAGIIATSGAAVCSAPLNLGR